jgi:hypothetical protein
MFSIEVSSGRRKTTVPATTIAIPSPEIAELYTSPLSHPAPKYCCEAPISGGFRVIPIQHRTDTAAKLRKSERLVQYLFRFLRALVTQVT